MKKTLILLLAMALIQPLALAQDESDMWTMNSDLSYYASVTASAEYRSKPAFKPLAYDTNSLFQDIKVTAVESVPFGFLLTFIGLWAYKAAEQSTLSPQLGTLEDNKQLYFISIGAFAVFNVLVNTVWFYDYSKDGKKGGTDEKVQADPQL